MISEKYSGFITVLWLVFFSLSCVSSAKQEIIDNCEKNGYRNKILLHKNPKVGDYVIRRVKSKNNREKLVCVITEVVKVEDGRVTIITEDDSYTSYVREEVADLQGNIIEAYIIDKEAGSRSRLRIAIPGDQGYIKDFPRISEISRALFPEHTKITVCAGTFDVTAVSMVYYPFNTVFFESIAYINQDIPFLVVKNVFIFKSKNFERITEPVELVEYSGILSLSTAEDESAVNDKGYKLVGTVVSVTEKEVIIGGNNISEKVRMGDHLTVFTGKEAIILDVVYPMMTQVRCSIITGPVSALKKGDRVYRISKDNKANIK